MKIKKIELYFEFPNEFGNCVQVVPVQIVFDTFNNLYRNRGINEIVCAYLNGRCTGQHEFYGVFPV